MIKVKLATIFSFISALIFAQETQSFSVEEAIQYALENNFDIINSKKDIESAKKEVWEATASGLPQVSANVDYDYFIQQPLSILPDFITPSVIETNRDLNLIDQAQADQAFRDLVGPSQGVIFGTPHNFSAGITVNQLLFSGSYIVGLQSAKIFKRISELSNEKSEAILKESVINSYSNVLLANENIEILKRNLETSDKNLYEITEIYKVGLGEEQSVDQAKYTNSQLKTSLNYAKRQKKAAVNSLKFLMGISQEDNVSLTTSLNDLMKDTELIDPNSEVNPEHIDKRLAENNVAAQELQVKYQKTFAFPELRAFLSHSYQEAGQDFTLFSDDKASFQTTLLGFRMAIPVFSSFQRRSQTEQAKIELDRAEVEYQKTMEQLKLNQENALLDYESALETLSTAKELVELSESIYSKEQIKFFEGLSQSLTLRNAETQLYDSQNQYIQAIFGVIQSKTALYQAYGNF